MATGSSLDELGNQATELAEEVQALREQMLRFATLQLRDVTQAEDAVHDAINAALSSNKYSGKGSLKSWVYAILRNKIIDIIRERSRHPVETFIEDDGSDLNDQFDEKGHWKKSQQPANWGQPETTLANKQFWLIFEACLNDLPESTAQVFMMREHLGLDIREICNELSLSESNCWVIMHRARMRLRKCLEGHFIQGDFLQAVSQ
ncbi:MAG: sigma-70 family RNA polymerase sigma factor [Gammaproteobacteria bacterium]|nr:sigma-70 family RNA polymerase sigma factor [Gammaproteobacteria bacterium]